jgi:hypothetical protein
MTNVSSGLELAPSKIYVGSLESVVDVTTNILGSVEFVSI